MTGVGGPVAIMAVDPGGRTGVARGIFGPGMEAGLRDALREGVGVETWVVEGDYRVQSWELAAEFLEWCDGLVEDGVFDNRVDMAAGTSLVVEDFQLRTQNVDLDPVMVMCGMLCLLVPRAAGLEGRLSLPAGSGGSGAQLYAHGVGVHLQQPADAMRFATNERLKEWGIGQARARQLFGKPQVDHRKDAFRHLCFRLARRMGGLVDTRFREGGYRTPGTARSWGAGTRPGTRQAGPAGRRPSRA